MQTHVETDHEELRARAIGALALAGAGHWLTGHYGAALLAGGRLLEAGVLPDESAQALAKRLGEAVRSEPDRYPLPAPGPRAATAALIEAIATNIDSLHNSAHGTIYLAAALRALDEQPELATGATLDALLALHARCQSPDVGRFYERTAEAMPTDEAICDRDRLIETVLAELATLDPDQQIDGRRYFFTGEKLHVVTHMHALVTLEDLGHRALARARARVLERQIWLARHRPPDARSAPGTGPRDPGERAIGPCDFRYWQPGGDPWHDIKFAQAAIALQARLPRARQRALEPALANAWRALGGVASDRAVRR